MSVLFLSQGEEWEDGTRDWLASIGGGELGARKYWPYQDGATPEETLAFYRDNENLIVEMILIDEKTDKMASWFGIEARFAQDPHNPTAIIGPEKEVLGMGGIHIMKGKFFHVYLTFH